MSSGRRYPVGVLNDTCMLTMSTYDLSSIYIIFVLALTLTTQDAYDGGNESSKLVSTIIFGRFIKLAIPASQS
jgi:hypothetical protein